MEEKQEKGKRNKMRGLVENVNLKLVKDDLGRQGNSRGVRYRRDYIYAVDSHWGMSCSGLFSGRVGEPRNPYSRTLTALQNALDIRI